MPGLINETIVEEMRFLRWQLLSRSIDLEPCMEPTDLVDFEQTHMLRFPADYRLYLLEVGNGVGMGGPCREGILQLGMTPFGYPLGFSDLLNVLDKPFPYDEEQIIDEEIRTANRLEAQIDQINTDYDREAALYLEIAQARHRNIGGYITLGTSMNSLDHFWILICEGNCRGEVWIVTWQGDFYPCTPRMTFKDWLVDWIEFGGYRSEQSLMNTQGYSHPSSLGNDYYELEEEQEDEEEFYQEEEPTFVYRRRGATTTLL